MSISETHWTPTNTSVEKKNTKYQLARAIIDIWNEVSEIEPEDDYLKNKLVKILLAVL